MKKEEYIIKYFIVAAISFVISIIMAVRELNASNYKRKLNKDLIYRNQICDECRAIMEKMRSKDE